MALQALDKVDTKDYDNVLKNFQSTAGTMSENENLGNWVWNVDGSDEARQRAEQAQFNSYMNYMQPQFEQQTSDLATALQNKGLAVGSEAYNRAMNNLQDNQNQAINQAAYNATTAGQNAYTQSLADAISAGNFANNAQSGYTNQVWNLLQNSMSGYDKSMQQANIWSEIYNQQQQAKQANKKGGWGGALTGAVQGFAQGMMTGNPYVAVANAGLQAYNGYNSKG